jgi:hypothetical protein
MVVLAVTVVVDVAAAVVLKPVSTPEMRSADRFITASM